MLSNTARVIYRGDGRRNREYNRYELWSDFIPSRQYLEQEQRALGFCPRIFGAPQSIAFEHRQVNNQEYVYVTAWSSKAT